MRANGRLVLTDVFLPPKYSPQSAWNCALSTYSICNILYYMRSLFNLWMKSISRHAELSSSENMICNVNADIWTRGQTMRTQAAYHRRHTLDSGRAEFQLRNYRQWMPLETGLLTHVLVMVSPCLLVTKWMVYRLVWHFSQKHETVVLWNVWAWNCIY